MTSDEHEPAIPDMPSPGADHTAHPGRAVALVAAVGGGLCLALVVIGLTVLGALHASITEVSSTGLAAIGSTLAGGFAGWIARGSIERRPDRAARRGDDPPGSPDRS